MNNDLMIINSLQDLVKGAVPPVPPVPPQGAVRPQTDAPKGPKLVMYNDTNGVPHTFFKLVDENGTSTFSGFGPEGGKRFKGDGKISDDKDHEYSTKTEFDISKEQYEKAKAFIDKSKENPPYYDLPNGYQCSVWAIELTNEIGLTNFKIDPDGGILQSIIINPWELALAEKLGIALTDYLEFLESIRDFIKNIGLYDPIALDLNNNGKIDTLTLENGVFFDHNGDEIAFKSSWISGGDGILARDINGDKEINSGAELFGNFTKLKNGELAKNGAEALKDLDDNNDGIFDSNDKAFNEILVWQDFNSNGKAESGELKSLREHGIKSINIEFLDDNTALDKDNKQILVGSFAINDSDNALASDIDFSVDTIQRKILDDTDGIIKGTGFVRNFNLSLNDEIKNAYESYKALNTKEQQLNNVETLVNLWAKTAKQYKELDNPIQKVKINISSVRSDTTSSGVEEAIKRANNNEITISDEILSNEGNIITSNKSAPNSKSLTPWEALALYEFKISDAHSAKIKELVTKAAVVSVFGGRENKVLYVSNNEEVESAIQSIEKAYDSIVTYVYKSLLVNTRLDKYAKNIEVNMDFDKDDFGFKLDFSKVEGQLLDLAKSDSINALIDYAEFNDIYENNGLKEGAEYKLISKAFEAEKLSSALTLLDDGQKRMILVSTQKLLAESMAKSDELSDEGKKVADMLNIKVLSANSSSSNGSAGSSLSGQNSNDIMLGSKGNDSLYGNNGDDTLNGDDGNDTLYGESGNDTLNGGKGDDTLEGGRGSDTYIFGKDWGIDTIYNYDSYRTNDNSKDIISFIDGIKSSDLSFSTNSNHDLIIKMEDNKITASNALATNSYSKISEIILGDEVLDYETIRELALSGTNEKQNIYGYEDKENIINAGGGDDYIEGHNKNDTINGEGGNDTISGNDGNDILNGGNGNDELYGGDGGDTLNGDANNDKLYGGDGNDTLNGGKGDDYLEGGRGSDTYVFGKDWGVDTIYNYDYYRTDDGSVDKISFIDGISKDNLEFSTNSNHDLIIKMGDNKLTANNALATNSYYKISEIIFDDNSELSFNEIKLLAAPKDEIA
nr:calcium-binding protein [uncultured Campylobacter sp.]